jgi:hypothetical protein
MRSALAVMFNSNVEPKRRMKATAVPRSRAGKTRVGVTRRTRRPTPRPGSSGTRSPAATFPDGAGITSRRSRRTRSTGPPRSRRAPHLKEPLNQMSFDVPSAHVRDPPESSQSERTALSAKPRSLQRDPTSLTPRDDPSHAEEVKLASQLLVRVQTARFGPIGMEQLWNRGGAAGGKGWARRRPENGLN